VLTVCRVIGEHFAIFTRVAARPGTRSQAKQHLGAQS
jgi:hypothetical protein